MEQSNTSEEDEARLRRLEQRGLIRRGAGFDPTHIDLEEEEVLPPGSTLLKALLEERRAGR